MGAALQSSCCNAAQGFMLAIASGSGNNTPLNSALVNSECGVFQCQPMQPVSRRTSRRFGCHWLCPGSQANPYRKVLEDDGQGRQLVETESLATWRFLMFKGARWRHLLRCSVLMAS